MREIGRKKARESRGFSILRMRMIEGVFQMEVKECKDKERLKMCRRNQVKARKVFGMG